MESKTTDTLPTPVLELIAQRFVADNHTQFETWLLEQGYAPEKRRLMDHVKPEVATARIAAALPRDSADYPSGSAAQRPSLKVSV